MAQMMMRSTRISPNMPVLLFFRLDQALLNPFFTDPTSSLQPDAGIDHAIQHVHDEVDHHEDHRHQKDDALHHRKVAGGDALDDQTSHARPGEDLLGDDRAAQQRGELHAQDGDDGAHRVFQGMLADDLAFGKTLGLCHIDILLAQHLDEVAAQEPADGGGS